MKVTTERTADCNAIVTVEVDDEQLNRAMKSAAQHISRVRPMPGISPRQGALRNCGTRRGQGTAARRGRSKSSPETLYKQVIVDEKIDVYDAGKLDIEQKEPVVLKFTIPTRPVVTLGDYRSIHMQPKEMVVGDDEVDQVLGRFQAEQAQMTPVTRAVQMGDLVTADVEGGLEGQEAMQNKGLQLRIEDGQAGVFRGSSSSWA